MSAASVVVPAPACAKVPVPLIELVTNRASERFKTKAKEIAAAFGMGGYQIMQVDVGAVDGAAEAGHRPVLMMAARSGMADAAPPVPAEPGRTTVQLSVSGSIRLK